MVTWLGVSVLFVLLAYWTIVLAGDEEKAVDDAVKYGSSNAVVQQTQDLTSLRKLTTRSVYNSGGLSCSFVA